MFRYSPWASVNSVLRAPAGAGYMPSPRRRSCGTRTVVETTWLLQALSETVATITYTGPITPHLTANMGCTIDLDCQGHNTGILGGAAWALALVA